MTWTLDDGSRLTEEVLSARGGPDLPFTPDAIAAKIRGIVAGPCPAMAPALERVMALDPATLACGWDALVAEMTG